MPQTKPASQFVNGATETRFYPAKDRSFEVPTNLTPEQVAAYPETLGKKAAPATDTEATTL